MNDYEKISDNICIKWIPNFDYKNKRYTQVSGYIFDNDNNLVIVKSENWTIPGGHPEKDESPEDTLNREVYEEACITIKDLIYLGAVEVKENNDIYYQLRYPANVDRVDSFKNEFEVSQREFVSLNDLNNYITWSEGITFKIQLESALDKRFYEKN